MQQCMQQYMHLCATLLHSNMVLRKIKTPLGHGKGIKESSVKARFFLFLKESEFMYTVFRCKGCNKEIILLTEEVRDTQFKRQYISCSHCGCRKLRKEKVTDNLKECMKERKYKREHGALKQI